MMKIKITREDGSLHSFDFYKKERCVFSISENGDMYYSIYGNGEFAKTILLGRIYKKLRQEQALEVIDVLTNYISKNADLHEYGCDVLPDCFTIFCRRKKESEIEVLSCDETDRIYNKIQKIVKIENFMSLTDQGD